MCPLAWLPIGTVEWHGEHNATGLDNLYTAAVVYPEEAKAKKIEGKVFVQFRVTTKGDADTALALKGEEILRPAATSAFMSARFKPGEIDGKPVNVWLQQVVRFDLD